MTRETVERLDWSAQETFNSMVDSYNVELEDLVSMLQELGIEDAKLRGAVYGWALNKAGI